MGTNRPKGDIPQFSAHVRCGQMDGWITMPLGTEVDVSPGDIVLDWNPALSQKGHSPPIFGPCLLWPNGWMDQDATWYGGRSRHRPHCVRWGQAPPERGIAAPSFRPLSIVAKRLPISATLSYCFLYNSVSEALKNYTLTCRRREQ